MVNLPEPGTKWRQGDSRYLFVAAVDRRRVLLYDEHDGSSLEVPTWQWPANLVLVPGAHEGEEAPRPIMALLVGGDEGEHFLRVKRLAGELGVAIVGHICGRVSSTRMPSRIPSDVELVIILQSHVSHGMSEIARKLADKQGLPWVNTESNGFKAKLSAEMQRKLAERVGGSTPPPVIDATWYEWNEEEEVWELRGEDNPALQTGGNDGGILAFLGLLVLVLLL